MTEKRARFRDAPYHGGYAEKLHEQACKSDCRLRSAGLKRYYERDNSDTDGEPSMLRFGEPRPECFHLRVSIVHKHDACDAQRSQPLAREHGPLKWDGAGRASAWAAGLAGICVE